MAQPISAADGLPLYHVDTLQVALSDAVAHLGIGGHLRAEPIARSFNPMSAEEFAHIAYATDELDVCDKQHSEATYLDQIRQAVLLKRFVYKACFGDLVALFKNRFDLYDKVRFVVPLEGERDSRIDI